MKGPSLMRRRVFLSGAILTGVGLPLLAGCKLPWQSKRQASSTSASAGGPAGAPAAPQGWQQLDGHIAGHHIIVNVSPIIRKDESTSILALELFRASDDKNRTESKPTSSTPDNKFTIVDYWGSRANLQPGNGVSAVRIMDLQTGRVWNSIDGSKADPEIAPGEKITYYVSFGKIDSEQVTVFVPMAGFVTVSVLEAGSAQQANIDLSAAQTQLDTLPTPNTTLAAPAPIERYTRSLDDSTSTHTGGKDITVTLASDVTFASDSADLAPGAQAQLQTVATQLNQHPDGGTLTIVGHTDDIQDDAYNQALSEKRANAVKTRLEQLTSLDKWKTSVSGKGESQPKIKDTTDQARAANRRVEITLTPTGGTTPKNTTTPTPNSSSGSGNGGGKLPDPQGPVAKGPEGVTLTSKGTSTSGEVTITLDHVTRKGGYLLGTVTCTVKNGSTGAPLHPLLDDPETALTNQRSESGALSTFYASDGLTLLSNGERIFPADYNDADVDHHLPLTELNLSDHLKTGTTTICVVWPDPGGNTITLDHPEGKYSTPNTAYRLTDIPIKNS